MALTQITICVLLIATAYAATIPDISDENFSEEIEMEDTPIKKIESNTDKNGVITEYNPVSPGFIISDVLESNGFEMGKSLAEGVLGLLQIVRQMSMSHEGMRNISFLVANMVSMLAGRYYETVKKLMPVVYGVAAALIQTLR